MIKKKTKKKILLISAIIIGIVLVAIISQIGKLPFSVGFQTLSVSQVNYQSNDPSLGTQAWILTVSQNGAGQSAYGTFNIEDDGASSDQFTLSLNLDKNYATYPIYLKSGISNIEWEKTKFNPFGLKAGCNADVWDHVAITGSIPYISDVYCYNFIGEGYYGTIGSANQNFQSTIKVEGSGGSDYCTITNTATSSCISNNGKIIASWAGSLVSGEAIPQPTDQGIIAVYDTAQGGWKTASQQAYNDWRSYDISGFGSCLNSGSNLDSCFENYHYYATKLMLGVPFIISGGEVPQVSGSQSSGQITVQLPTQVQFPLITMRIKASLIGINIPVGKPSIISTNSEEFSTGQTGIISTTIKNIGTGSGNFNVGVSCSSGFSQTGNALTISNLAPSSQQTIYIPITANVISQVLSGTCTITATDINNPSNYDTKQVSVSASSLAVCTSGDKRISGNSIQECKSNSWVTIENCDSDEIAQYVNTIPKCVPIGTTIQESGNIFSSISDFFSNLFSGVVDFFFIIKLIVSLIVLVFGTLYSKDFIESFKSLRGNEVASWMLSILIGILLAIFIFASFWIGLIVFIIYIAFRLIVGGKLSQLKKGIKDLRR